MKKLLLIGVLALSGFALSAQVITDEAGFQTFELKEADTTYIMKQYFLVLLKSGSERSQNQEEALEIQKGHMANIDSLANIGKLDLAGPMGDDIELRGILVLRVPTLEEAKACIDADPAVKANRLSYEIHPWWAAVGSTLR